MTTIGAGGGVELCREAIDVAETHADHVWATVGIHPHAADQFDEAFMTELRAMAEHEKVRAIGESGLDYHYMNSPREIQIASFEAHVALARDVGLPIVVHTREADDDTIDVLERCGASECGGVIHCFSSSKRLGERALELGFHLSFSGIATFKNADEIREVAKLAPADRILVETDAPFLAPVPMRGKTNEPAYVVHTATRIAEARGEDLEAFAAQTTTNAERFYGLTDDGA